MRAFHFGRCFLLLAATWAVACNDDGPVLWRLAGDGGDGGMGEAGGNPQGGSGGVVVEPPPLGGFPPEPPICDEANEPPEPNCLCPEFEACICGPPPPPPQPPEPAELCSIQCADNFCNLRCAAERQCDLNCGVDCVVVCETGSICTVGCSGACNVVCEQGAACTLWSWDAPSQIYCEQGSLCECPLGMCECSGPGCPPMP